ncbi:MAG: hypothetical protein ABIJ21_01705 [Nanoarchaeota archaeon]
MGLEERILTPKLSSGLVLLDVRAPERNGTYIEAIYWDLDSHQARSMILTQEHVIPTWDLGDITARHHREASLPLLDRLGISIEEVPFASFIEEERSVLIAVGPREMKNLLPKPFIIGSKNDQRNSPTRTARTLLGQYNYSPAQKLQLINILAQEKAFAFDLEVRGRPKYDDIFLCPTILLERGKPLQAKMYITDPYPVTNIRVPTPAGILDCELISVPDHVALAHALTEDMHDARALFCPGQNHGTYDSKQLNVLTGAFEPGITRKKHGGIFVQKRQRPRNRGGGFFRRFEIPGMIMIDYAPFHQKFMSLPNNKLETIANYWGFPFMKAIHSERKFTLDPWDDGYSQLEDWGQAGKRLRELDPLYKADPARYREEYEATKKQYENALYYALPDAVLHLMIAYKETKHDGMKESLLLDILWGSMLLECDPSKLCVTSKKEQARSFWEGRLFKRLHTFSDRQLPTPGNWDDYDYYDSRMKALDIPETKRGIFNVTVIVPTPEHYGLSSIIAGDGFAQAFHERQQESSPKHKEILLQMLDTFLMKPSYDLAHNRPTPRTDRFFGKIYGLPFTGETANMRTCNERLEHAQKAIDDLLATTTVINHNKKYILLEGDVDVSALEAQGIAFKRGYGRAVSHTKGSFVVAIDGNATELLASGTDIYGRRGKRIPLEEKTITLLYQAYFSSDDNRIKTTLASLAEYLQEETVQLKENLVFSGKAKKDYTDYRARAHTQERIQYLIHHGVKKGERYAYGYGIREGTDDNYPEETFFNPETRIDTERYLSKLFGPIGKKGRRFSEGSIGNILLTLYANEQGRLPLVLVREFNTLIDGETYERRHPEQTALNF